MKLCQLLVALAMSATAVCARAQDATEPGPAETPPTASTTEQHEALEELLTIEPGPAKTPPAVSVVEQQAAPEELPTIPLPRKPPPPPPKEAPAHARLEEIVVTATKREESARDIAGTVNAISGANLADRGIQDIEDIVTSVPGVNLVDERSAGSANSNKRITIRGIAAGQNQADTVGVFIDETPFTDPLLPVASADINPFDIGQVEVLKGPVGTLFGGSALNGAIRYLPQAPKLGEWEGQAFTEWRKFQYGGSAPIYGAALNMPLFGRDDLALRVVGIDRKTAGYVDSVNQVYKAKDVNSLDQNSVRAILRWQPISELDMSLMFVHQDTLSRDYSTTTVDQGGRYESDGSPRPSPSDVSYDLWQFKSTYKFDWADLVLVASRSDKSLSGTYDTSTTLASNAPFPLLGTIVDSSGKPSTQEVRLVSSRDGDWDWLAGIFNSNYKIRQRSSTTIGDTTVLATLGNLLQLLPVPLFTDHGVVFFNNDLSGTVAEHSAFGEVNWRFAPDWQATVGLRRYEFQYDAALGFGGPLCIVTSSSCVLTLLNSERTFKSSEHGISPKFSLKWDVSDDLMIYATAARGFRFGGINFVVHPEIPPTYRSDALWSYELGTRTQWFDKTLIADVTAFYIDWKNAQFQTTTSDGVSGYTDNVGAVKGRGVEGQIVWLTPLLGVKLTAMGSYADIVTAAAFIKGSTNVPAGARWPRAPRLQTTTMLDWTDVWGSVEVSAGVNHTYLGKALQNFGFNSNVVIFGYSTLGLQLTAKPVAGGLWPNLAINLNNLTNVKGLNYDFMGGVALPGAPRPELQTLTAPRNLSVRLTFNF